MRFQTIVEEIMSSHHSLLRRELPKITEQLHELVTRYPDNENLAEAQQIYTKVRSKVETHLRDEETVLFPIGIAIESGTAPMPTEMNLHERLAEMEKEHDGCGKALAGVQLTISSTVPPSDAREKLLATIQLVQEDFVEHVEKENSKVHPLFIQLLEHS